MIRKLVILFLLAALIISPTVGADGWTQDRYDATNTAGYSGDPGGTWAYDVGVNVDSRLVMVNGTVYFYDSNGRLHSFNPAEGERNWVYEGEGTPTGSPLIDGNTVYVESNNGVTALEEDSGDVRWTIPVQPSISPPSVQDGTLYVSEGGSIYAYNSSTGRSMWSSSVEGDRFLLAAAYEGVYGIGIDQGAIERFQQAVSENVQQEVRETGKVPDVIDYGSYVPEDVGMRLQKFSDDGHEEWAFSNGIPTEGVAVHQDRAYLSTLNYTLHALDTDSGESIWGASTPGEIHPVPPIYHDGNVLVSTDSGSVYAFDASTGDEVWSNDMVYNGTNSLALSEGTVYATARGGGHESVYAYSADNGELNWSISLDGQPSAPTAVGSAVLVASGTNIYSVEDGEVRSPIRVVDEITSGGFEEEPSTEANGTGNDTGTDDEDGNVTGETEDSEDNTTVDEIGDTPQGSFSMILPLLVGLLIVAVMAIAYIYFRRE